MSAASHLGIRFGEYDRRIATFIPGYHEMLDVAAKAATESLPRSRPGALLDLGTGSGALAARCLARRPALRVVGIDADEDMLALAIKRLGSRLIAVSGNLATAPYPPCDVITASLSLHHLRTHRARLEVYRRSRRALHRGGRLVTADRYLSSHRDIADADQAAWVAHLARSYSAKQAARFLRAWAKEDVYVPLMVEVELMGKAGLRPDVIWRRDGFAVVAARV